jgi:hypothetical protein
MAKMALKNAINNPDDALEYLLKLQNDGTYDSILSNLAGKVELFEIYFEKV